MKWKEKLANADINMSMHARKYGFAKLEILYYGEGNGLVRKEVVENPCLKEKFYDSGIDED
jgi:hypothetical protein